ncbi:MAG: YciI family protein [Chitinophagaceae bacterium]
MIRMIFPLFLMVLCSTVMAQKAPFNKSLADSLGADEYGMKMYSLVILKTGDFKTTDKQVLDSLFRGHMQNISRLSKAGKLVVAGPLGENKNNYRGIFIFTSPTPEEAKALVDSDPAVKAGLFDVEIYPWYGSAALPLYLGFHETIEQKKP